MPVNSRYAEQPAEEEGEAAEEQEGKRKKLTAEEKAIFPETDALQVEMGNIVMRSGSCSVVLYDVARTNQHKDRYSALSMAVRYIAELEEQRKKRLLQPGSPCVGVVSIL